MDDKCYYFNLLSHHLLLPIYSAYSGRHCAFDDSISELYPYHCWLRIHSRAVQVSNSLSISSPTNTKLSHTLRRVLPFFYHLTFFLFCILSSSSTILTCHMDRKNDLKDVFKITIFAELHFARDGFRGEANG